MTTDPRFTGATYPATVEGWKRLVADVNVQDAAGFDLIGVFPLSSDSKVGALWRRRDVEARKRSASMFFE